MQWFAWNIRGRVIVLGRAVNFYLARGISTMEREKTYANGQPVSSQRGNILTYYFKSGVVKATGPVQSDLTMDGRWVFYRENGMLWQEGHFKSGEKHGMWVRYDKLGQVEYEAEFAGGKEIRKQLYR